METLAIRESLEPVMLSRTDVPALCALHRETLAALPNPGAVRPDGPDFFEDVFDCGGEILGLFAEEGMAAYGVLRPELERERDRFSLAPRVPAAASLWVLDGSAVKPSFWRRGLQRHIVALRIERAAAFGAAHVIAKASPGNVPSMRNLLKSGFATVGLIRKSYGWRYIHHRTVEEAHADPEAGVWIEAALIEEAQRRLDQGELGYACAVTEAGTPVLRFAPEPR